MLIAWKDALLGAAGNPLETAFPTISNDESGARSWGPGARHEKLGARHMGGADAMLSSNVGCQS